MPPFRYRKVNRKGEFLPTTYRFEIDTARGPNSIQRILFGSRFESIEPRDAARFFSRVWLRGHSGKKATVVKLRVWVLRTAGTRSEGRSVPVCETRIARSPIGRLPDIPPVDLPMRFC